MFDHASLVGNTVYIPDNKERHLHSQVSDFNTAFAGERAKQDVYRHQYLKNFSHVKQPHNINTGGFKPIALY